MRAGYPARKYSDDESRKKFSADERGWTAAKVVTEALRAFVTNVKGTYK